MLTHESLKLLEGSGAKALVQALATDSCLIALGLDEVDQLAAFSQSVEEKSLVVKCYRMSPGQRREARKPQLEGVILNNFAHTTKFMRRLVREVIDPVSAAYPQCAAKEPAAEGRHCWLEPLHLTINLCLGPEFTGGELVITTAEGDQVTTPQVPGRAIIHGGGLVHHSNDITSTPESNLETFEFGALPAELQQAVVDRLPTSDLCAMRLVSRLAHEQVKDAGRA